MHRMERILIFYLSLSKHIYLNKQCYLIIPNLFQGPPCYIDIQKDLPKDAQPLYLKPHSTEFWLPNYDGKLQIPRGASIELYCSNSFANFSENANVTNNFYIKNNTKFMQPICMQDQYFLWNNEKFEFKQFQCQQYPKYAVQQMNLKCGERQEADIYRVGFNISCNRFVETLRVCYNKDILSALYVQHELSAASIQFQRYVKRLNFSKSGHFQQHNMNYYYSQKHQLKMAKQMLSPNLIPQYFDNKTLFLARGHLAAKADLIYATQQRSTFTFFNAAPQWQSFNGGQWQTLENEVRNYIGKMKMTVKCYTGTWGIMKLANKEFYLTQDANNNGLLPVPMLYFRVLVSVYNPQQGIALIGVNNPHASREEILSEYIICDDVTEQLTWLKWIKNKKLKKGYLYACQVRQFASMIRFLPKELQNVTELMGS